MAGFKLLTWSLKTELGRDTHSGVNWLQNTTASEGKHRSTSNPSQALEWRSNP